MLDNIALILDCKHGMDLREIKRDTNEWEMHLTKDQVCLGYRFQN
jgi:hypothetical protein